MIQNHIIKTWDSVNKPITFGCYHLDATTNNFGDLSIE